MPESLGGRLRRQREQQNIPLVTIAEQTKIKASLLEALERDDVSRWPSGIFRRAYIRAYAHAIGLNPDQVVREFLETYPDPMQESEPVEAIAAAHGIAGTTGTPTRLHFLVDSALASLSRLRGSSGENPSHAAATAATSDAAERPPDIPAVEQLSGASATEGDAPVEGIRATASDADVDRLNCAAEQVAGRHEPPRREPRLLEFASVCTQLARIERADQMQSWLQKAAGVLDAQGLIVWVWRSASGTLAPALVHGYSEQVIAQLPTLTTAADNVTAAAFRSGVPCIQPGTDHVNGALAVPLPMSTGSSGVLAVELRDGAERSASTRAIASILAAMLAQLIGERPGAQAEDLQGDAIGESADPELDLSCAGSTPRDPRSHPMRAVEGF